MAYRQIGPNAKETKRQGAVNHSTPEAEMWNTASGFSEAASSNAPCVDAGSLDEEPLQEPLPYEEWSHEDRMAAQATHEENLYGHEEHL